MFILEFLLELILEVLFYAFFSFVKNNEKSKLGRIILVLLTFPLPFIVILLFYTHIKETHSIWLYLMSGITSGISVIFTITYIYKIIFGFPPSKKRV